MTPVELRDASCTFDFCRDLGLKLRTLEVFPAFISKLTTVITKSTGSDILATLSFLALVLKHLTFYFVISLPLSLYWHHPDFLLTHAPFLSLPVSSYGMKRMLKDHLELLALEQSTIASSARWGYDLCLLQCVSQNAWCVFPV